MQFTLTYREASTCSGLYMALTIDCSAICTVFERGLQVFWSFHTIDHRLQCNLHCLTERPPSVLVFLQSALDWSHLHCFWERPLSVLVFLQSALDWKVTYIVFERGLWAFQLSDAWLAVLHSTLLLRQLLIQLQDVLLPLQNLRLQRPQLLLQALHLHNTNCVTTQWHAETSDCRTLGWETTVTARVAEAKRNGNSQHHLHQQQQIQWVCCTPCLQQQQWLASHAVFIICSHNGEHSVLCSLPAATTVVNTPCCTHCLQQQQWSPSQAVLTAWGNNNGEHPMLYSSSAATMVSTVCCAQCLQQQQWWTPHAVLTACSNNSG